MPFYEYECSSCKYYTEVMQKISDAPLRKCPSCGRNTLKKLISAPNFRLKGGGWYETDFKSDKENKRNLAGGEKEEPRKAEASADPGSKGSGDAKSGDSKGGESKSKPVVETVASRTRSGTARKPAAAARKSPARPAAKSKARAKSGARRARR